MPHFRQTIIPYFSASRETWAGGEATPAADLREEDDHHDGDEGHPVQQAGGQTHRAAAKLLGTSGREQPAADRDAERDRDGARHLQRNESPVRLLVDLHPAEPARHRRPVQRHRLQPVFHTELAAADGRPAFVPAAGHGELVAQLIDTQLGCGRSWSRRRAGPEGHGSAAQRPASAGHSDYVKAAVAGDLCWSYDVTRTMKHWKKDFEKIRIFF